MVHQPFIKKLIEAFVYIRRPESKLHHKTRVTLNFFRDNQINFLPLPLPIEQIYDIID